jgi:hypothetical protein
MFWGSLQPTDCTTGTQTRVKSPNDDEYGEHEHPPKTLELGHRWRSAEEQYRALALKLQGKDFNVLGEVHQMYSICRKEVQVISSISSVARAGLL